MTANACSTADCSFPCVSFPLRPLVFYPTNQMTPEEKAAAALKRKQIRDAVST